MKRRLSDLFDVFRRKGGFFNAQKNAVVPSDRKRIAELVEDEVVLKKLINESKKPKDKEELKRELEDQKLELEMFIIQKSTRTTLPQFIRLHNKFRMKYRWYYNWHLLPYAGKVHWATLFTSVGACLAVIIGLLVIGANSNIAWASQPPKLVVMEQNPEKTPCKFFFKSETGKCDQLWQKISDDENGLRIRTKSGTPAGYQDILILGNEMSLFDGDKLVATGTIQPQEQVDGKWQNMDEAMAQTPEPLESQSPSPPESISPSLSPSILPSLSPAESPSPEITSSPEAYIHELIRHARAEEASPTPEQTASSPVAPRSDINNGVIASPEGARQSSHSESIRRSDRDHLKLTSTETLENETDLSTTLEIATQGEGKAKQIVQKQTFSLPANPDGNLQRIVFNVDLKAYDIKADQSVTLSDSEGSPANAGSGTPAGDSSQAQNDKSRQYGNTVLDTSDYQGEQKIEEKAASDSIDVIFNEAGTTKAIEIDPIFTVTTPPNQISVDDGTRKWVFDTGLVAWPRYFYHNSIGSGSQNLAIEAAANAGIGPVVGKSGTISSVTHTLVENTPTRVRIRTEGSYTTSPTNVDNYFTIYPTGEAFLSYSFAHTNAEWPKMGEKYLNTDPQVLNHDNTNHATVISDTSNNNYAGMSVVPYTSSEFFDAAGWSNSISAGLWAVVQKSSPSSPVSGNMVIDFSNYRATTTTRDNLKNDYRTPATMDTFTKGTVGAPAYSQGEGTYNITADGSGDSGFTFHWGSKTRYKPAFKISGASRAEDTYQVSWGGAVKTKGIDYNLSKLVDGTTLVMQILSDIGADITLTVDSGTTTNNIWTNGSTDGKWSTDANWSAAHKPTASENVVFGSTNTTDCSIDAVAVVGSVTLASGYSGTVTANASLTDSGDFSLEQGTYNAGSTTLTINGSWSRVGGTFTAGTGTVVFGSTSTGKTILSGGQSFYNVDFNGSGGGWTLSDNITIANDLAVSAGTLTGGSATITVSGSVNLTGGAFTRGTSTLKMDGTTKNLIGASQTLNNLTISGTVTATTSDVSIAGILTVDNTKQLTIDTGRTVTMNAGSTTTINGTITGAGTLLLINSAGANLSTGGTLSSVVRFVANGADITIPARTYGGQVTIQNTSDTRTATLGTAGGQTLTFQSHFYVDANQAGNMNVTAATWNPTINISGDLDYTGAGAGTESITMGSGTWSVRGTVDVRGGTVTADSSTLKLTSTAAGKNIYSNGQSWNNVTFDGVGGGWTLQDDMRVAGNWTRTNGVINAGSFTVIFNDTSGGKTITSGGQSFYNLTFNGVGGGWTLQDQLTTNNLQLTNGNLNASNKTINVAGNWTKTGGTFTEGTSTVALGGASLQTIAPGGGAFNNLTVTNNSAGGVTFADILTVNGTFTDTTASSLLTFKEGVNHTINTLNWQGGNTEATLIQLRSSNPGTQYQLTYAAITSADYLDVMDADNNGAIIPVVHAKDSGNNTNWYLTDNYTITTTTPEVCGAGWAETVQARDFYNNNSTSDSATQITLTSSSANVKFYTGGTYLIETTTYNLANGAHIVYVKDNCMNNETMTITSTDAYAKAITSGNIAVGNEPPVAAIASPANGAVVGAGTVQIAGTASDPLGGVVALVEVQINSGAWQAATGTTNWSYNYAVSSSGTYTVKARATDSLGLVGPESATITFKVDTEIPSVVITKPVTDEWITTATYAVTGTSVDLGASPIEKVEISINEGSWHEATSTSSNYATWTYAWTPTNGEVTIQAKATDGVNNISQIYQVKAKVDINPPTRPASAKGFDIKNNLAKTSGVLLSWKASTDEGSGLKEYDIYRGADKVGTTTTDSWYMDKDGSAANTYIIKAVDNAGNSSDSDSVKPEATSDTTPLNISDVKAESSPLVTQDEKTFATVVWKTDKPATSEVSYGLGQAKANDSKPDGKFNTSHLSILSDLKPNTTYHYQIKSTDMSGNAAETQDSTFTTQAGIQKDNIWDTILKTLEKAFEWMKEFLASSPPTKAVAGVLQSIGVIKSPEQVSPSLIVLDVSNPDAGLYQTMLLTNLEDADIQKATDGKNFTSLGTAANNYLIDTGLDKNTTYYYKIKDQESLVTVKPAGIDDSSPVITNIKTQELITTAEKSQYLVTFSTDKLTNAEVSLEGQLVKEEGQNQNHSLVLDNLKPSQTYKYEIKATDPSTSLGARSPTQSLTTKEVPAEETIWQLILNTLQGVWSNFSSWIRA